jgi:predicted dehydrogenase/threonine dehydrogenase-like Zn-dependent dehydrogenase
MKQIVLKSGRSILEKVPSPTIVPGTILVKVLYSCISQGTEIIGLRNTGKNRAEKIISTLKEKPQAIQKAIQIYKEQGFTSLTKKIYSSTNSSLRAQPTGYSVSGVVEAIGENVDKFAIGDLVACAGAGMANHSEYVLVPKNLTMKIPKGLDLKLASTVTLGGIALQGVRRADMKLGEFTVVLGLGFIGQLTVQLLSASGGRVIAMDIDQHRCDVAKSCGAEIVLNTQEYSAIEEKVFKITNGFGADSVIFTAATSNPSIISSAFKMCKRKGKVVLVGIAGDTIHREDIYAKELDFLISTSYGPGRYDHEYEMEGNDYPYSYVRWTENRNMAEYLRLLSRTLQIEELVEKVYPLNSATEAYKELENLEDKPIIALFEYPVGSLSPSAREEVERYTPLNKSIFNVALVGAGNFASAVHLPNLALLKDMYNIYAICDINPLNAKEVATQYAAQIATTDYREILSDSKIDLVIVCTRHDLHAEYAIQALNAGKAVFVEKPMAINQNELDKLVKVVRRAKIPFMVGFNRRFSPLAIKIKENIQNRTNPMIISYRMNAGYVPIDGWVHKNGGRIIGEGCHIIDLFNYFTESNIQTVSVDKISPNTGAILSSDNVSINLKYQDGSVGNFVYTALGNSRYPKEILELYCDNNVYRMTDYLELDIIGNKSTKLSLKKPDKGYAAELIEFYDTLTGKSKRAPIDLDSMIQTTKTTFLIE